MWCAHSEPAQLPPNNQLNYLAEAYLNCDDIFNASGSRTETLTSSAFYTQWILWEVFRCSPEQKRSNSSSCLLFCTVAQCDYDADVAKIWKRSAIVYITFSTTSSFILSVTNKRSVKICLWWTRMGLKRILVVPAPLCFQRNRYIALVLKCWWRFAIHSAKCKLAKNRNHLRWSHIRMCAKNLEALNDTPCSSSLQ